MRPRPRRGAGCRGANADFTEICRALKSILFKDSNAAVVAEAGLVAAALASGARREFSWPAKDARWSPARKN